jgi:hypothetical protein
MTFLGGGAPDAFTPSRNFHLPFLHHIQDKKKKKWKKKSKLKKNITKLLVSFQ